MATVRQAMALQDGVSPVLNKIMASMRSTIGIMQRMNSQASQGIPESEFRATERAIRDAEDALEAFNADMNKTGDATSEVNGGFTIMGGIIANIAADLIQRIPQAMGTIVSMSDRLTSSTTRLNLVNEQINGGLKTTEEMQNKIFAAAERSRGSYSDMVDQIAKLGTVAGKAFSGTDEITYFTELMNKQFTVAGADSNEQSSAMYQLTQALGSGKLQGDEYRTIIESAPLLAQSILDYMHNVKGVQGQLKDMASEGLLTADVIKAALYSSADDINARFEQMPKTWDQTWTSMVNKVQVQLQPVLTKINELVNSEKFQTFASSAAMAFGSLVTILANIGMWVVNVAMWFADNWSWISPIIYGIVAALGAYLIVAGIVNTINSITAIIEGVKAAALAMSTGATFAATAAQYGLNAALLACPLTWIILLIIAVVVAIFMVIAAIQKVTGSTDSALGWIVGALMTAVAFIWNLFLALVDLVLMIINIFWNKFAAFANFFGNVFTDPIGSIIHLFGDMADSVLGILESIASAIDKLFGSNLAEAVSGWRGSLDAKIDAAAKKHGNGKYEEKVAEANLTAESLGLSRWAYTDAFSTGNKWGNSATESISGFMDKFKGSGAEDVAALTADDLNKDFLNDGKVNASGSEVSITDEDLKYLRDIAKVEYVNRYTTSRPQVNVTFGDVHETADVDQVLTVLEDRVSEAYDSALDKE